MSQPVSQHRKVALVVWPLGIAGIAAAAAAGVPWHIIYNLAFSLVAFQVALHMIPSSGHLFVKASLFGVDLNKSEKAKVPEALGVVSAAIYLVVLFVFLLVHFQPSMMGDTAAFPYHEFVEFLAALLSICVAVLLGFADDVLDLRWRDKVILPTIATLPLLMVYTVNGGSTTVLVPKPLQEYLDVPHLDLGPIYYIYMGMLAVFCTNAINILAGVNGVEAGQSVVIAISLLAHSSYQLVTQGYQHEYQLSIFLLMPFIGVTSALLYHNWFPAQVFVGDTFCYFAGMTFAVTGILGHFSKTLLLFMIPQILNFLYSVPQLFHAIPCPRHRLPKFQAEKRKVDMSYSPSFDPAKLSLLGRIALWFIRTFRLAHIEVLSDQQLQISNLTILNFFLFKFGPMREETLVIALLFFQTLCTVLAFYVRYVLAGYVYDYVE